MANRYGVDTDYFEKWMARIKNGIENYKPDEIAREFARMSKAADSSVMHESEFQAITEQQVRAKIADLQKDHEMYISEFGGYDRNPAYNRPLYEITAKIAVLNELLNEAKG